MELCSYFGCQKWAVWRIKPGWMGVDVGQVCEEHHCWERIIEEEEMGTEIEQAESRRRVGVGTLKKINKG